MRAEADEESNAPDLPSGGGASRSEAMKLCGDELGVAEGTPLDRSSLQKLALGDDRSDSSDSYDSSESAERSKL